MNKEGNRVDSTPAQHVSNIIDRFEHLNTIRDRALNDGRQVVRLSANTIRAIHRGQLSEAESDLGIASTLIVSLRRSTQDHGDIYWAGYVQDAMKEFAEASISLSIVREQPMPGPADLGVEDAPYLNALAEAASELRRLILDTLRTDKLPLAEQYLTQMDEIYGVLVTVDFPDAITGGLRRTTDQLRSVLERTRGDVTLTLNQRRLERVLTTSASAPDQDQLDDGGIKIST
jgi:translin